MSLPLIQLVALSGAMLVLAALPSLSTLTVAARALGGGWRHGVATTAGVVLGDGIWIALALGGHRWLGTRIDGRWLAAIGGSYLLAMAVLLWRSAPPPAAVSGAARAPTSLAASALAGLLLTLGDQKALLFYLGFLPAFVGTTALTWVDGLAIAAVAMVAVGLPKLVYAALAARAGARLDSRWLRRLQTLAALLVALAALWLLVSAIRGNP